MKKLTALLLAVFIAISLCSCTKNKTANTHSARDFKLPFSASDSLNPYTCKTDANHYLCSLLYESLFTISKDCTAKKVLAHSFVKESRTITVNLASKLFSDKSSVTADDVIYSFNQAKKNNYYKVALETFVSAESKGSSVVRFTLSENDRYALCDLIFPIVKSKNPDIGSGTYIFEKSNDGDTLIYNKESHGKKPNIEKIILADCSDNSNTVNMLNNGEIDYAFDTLEDGNIKSATGNSTPGMMKNLIFLGLNATKNNLKKVSFRQGISYALDQKNIVATAFKGYGFATATPFNPNLADMGSVVTNSTQGKKEEASDAFLKAGCVYDDMGVNLLSGDKRITLSLIVNSSNNMKIEAAKVIKNQLINVGIDVEIKIMPFDEYTVAIENGNFDLYIGEVKIENNYFLDCFFTQNGGATFGITDKNLFSEYSKYKDGSATLQEFVTAFSSSNPFVPICYKGADICCSAGLEGNSWASENNIYNGIEDWIY